MKLLLSLLLLSAFFITSCATADLSLSKSAEQDFYKAERLFEDEQYARAVQYLGKFTAKYPYSSYIVPAKIIRIKAAYANNEFILSETLAARFIDAHPAHQQRDYAEYMLGMSYFKQSESAKHEQVFSKKAKQTFTALYQRNPNGEYAQEAKKYTQELTNRIAEHEMFIGKFYAERGLYVGAINRFIVVKNNFSESSAAPESLYWLASSYIALAQQTYAQQIIKQLEKNFAGNEWQQKAETLM
ncbi:MAG TPA: outer membrane protein assembly factor BamD [Mariprofundaceae bacterium]|nr:outer membrane protein assembly factor BamD [Mariprofundaceae bacterium]